MFSTLSYSRLGEGYMNATWYWSKSTTDTRNKLRRGSDPDFSSVGCNPSFFLVLLLAENLIKIIERGNIDEISQELTPKALAKCGRNALLVAMEVFWGKFSQSLTMNSQFTFSLTYVQRSEPFLTHVFTWDRLFRLPVKLTQRDKREIWFQFFNFLRVYIVCLSFLGLSYLKLDILPK